MKVPFVDLKAQYQSIKTEIDEAIGQVLENTGFIGGSVVQEFEEGFASYLGVNHCIACANGTDSMEILLKAMDIGPGDEVIVPANSWISTAEVVSNVGAEPVFVDVLEREYTMNPELIERAITSKTKAVIPVHLYGLPARMNEILEVARKNNLKVIEDSAQAHGAAIGGQKIGTLGDAASFSFYPGKNLGAYGDAGGIVTNDTELAEKCRRIGNHGQLEKHDHKIIGRNSRMDTLQAAVLKVKLPYLDQWVKGRNEVARTYLGNIKNEEVILPFVPEGYEHAFHLFVIQTHNRTQIAEVLRKAGIATGIHYPTPLPFTEAYSYKGCKPEDFPVSVNASASILSLPIYPELSVSKVERVVEKVLSVI